MLQPAFSFYLVPLSSVPLHHVEVLDVVYINLSISHLGSGRLCEMMLFDNVHRNKEKNRAGRGNHRGQAGNRSQVTQQLSISFLALLSLSLSGDSLAHAATFMNTNTHDMCFLKFIYFPALPEITHCGLLSFWRETERSFSSGLQRPAFRWAKFTGSLESLMWRTTATSHREAEFISTLNWCFGFSRPRKKYKLSFF